ncbi:uncharacterized protein LOC127710728 [Mytilus californianus]|uniref:uncharacterized protein LOC127710728 n=1 Tax=Mytilus californianus TaxID=6549 RepID=UPI00224694BA|nr:uncharacterized protein LOC127710728 [Mytilus californianus]
MLIIISPMKDKNTKEKENSMNLYSLRIYLKPGRISPNTELIMHEQILIIALIVFLFSGKTNTLIKVKCPSGKQLYLRAKSVCLSVEKYTCLLDYVNNINKENCNGPKTEPPGDKTVVNSGNFDTESCLLMRFQPFSFSTSQGNNCIYKKTMCIEEGQLIYSNGTSVYDRKCRCDYTKNFSFVSAKRVDMCSCDPTTEDCSCYTKLCSIGQILTPDYQCVKIEDSYGKFVCKDIEIQSSETKVEKLNENVLTNTNELVGQNGKNLEVLIVCSAGIIVVGILCMFLIPLLHETVEIFNTDQNTKTKEYKSKYRIHKAKLESYQNKPYEFTVLKDLIEDGTIEIYDSPKNTTYIAHTEEEQAIQKLFEEYKSDYIIRRREVEH